MFECIFVVEDGEILDDDNDENGEETGNLVIDVVGSGDEGKENLESENGAESDEDSQAVYEDGFTNVWFKVLLNTHKCDQNIKYKNRTPWLEA